MSNHVCSNCGQGCGSDARMGSLDVYLLCECASAKNSHWVNDGRGGYTVHLNDAHPISAHEYNRTPTRPVVPEKSIDWSREDD